MPYEHEEKRAQSGFNDNADPELLPRDKASLIIGLASKSPGILERAVYVKRIKTADAIYNDGIFEYNGASASLDRVFIVRNGGLSKATLSAGAAPTVKDSLNPSISALTAVTNSSGITFATGARVRMVQHLNECFFVQDGGLQPVRYSGLDDKLYQVGMTKPVIPTDGGQSTAGGLLTSGAAYKYEYTYADEYDRESSPSPVLSVTMGANGGRQIGVTLSTDAQVKKIYLYRTAANATLFYRVKQAGYSNATATLTDKPTATTDENTDTNIVLNTAAPIAGLNDVPLSASLIAKYKNRIVLNDVSNRSNLQISNLGTPTGFPVLGRPAIGTDGQNLQIIDQFGDEITALGHLGSVLGIWTRRTLGFLYGSGPVGGTDGFSYKQSHHLGCVASDSVVECGNVVAFMGEDAIYVVSYNDGLMIEKLSEDLDNTFQSASVLVDTPGVYPLGQTYTRESRAAACMGWFVQNRLYYAIPPYLYIYDFSNKSWTSDYPVGGHGSNNGVLSGAVFHASRQYQVVLLTSQYIGDSTKGDVWCLSFYPLQYSLGEIGSEFNFVYQQRAADGAGVARSRVKRMERMEVFGDVALPDGDVNVADISGSISFKVDMLPNEISGGYFDNLSRVGTAYVGAHWNRDQQEGKLAIINCSPHVVGRIIQATMYGLVNGGRLKIRGSKFMYVPLGD